MVLRNLLGTLVVEAKLLSFLERLTGEPVAANDTVSLSSTQRARLVAWLNDHSIPANLNQLKTNLIRIPELLNGAADGSQSSEVPGESEPGLISSELGARSSMRLAPGGHGPVLGVGIDIQARASMPQVPDFRADSFYSANFSPDELAHCIQQSDPIVSLAGLWAAKEAILKAGVSIATAPKGFSHIEILRAPDGSPYYPGCLLSISHDDGIAVAVCIRLA